MRNRADGAVEAEFEGPRAGGRARDRVVPDRAGRAPGSTRVEVERIATVGEPAFPHPVTGRSRDQVRRVRGSPRRRGGAPTIAVGEGATLFLRSLTLKGFKSFADKTTLEFEPGVCVVVGPNGSGKSNIVDSVAWVLGAQGARALRGGKMDDVIFAGTADRPALGRAEVVAHDRQHRAACSRSSSPRSRSPARCSAPASRST